MSIFKSNIGVINAPWTKANLDRYKLLTMINSFMKSARDSKLDQSFLRSISYNTNYKSGEEQFIAQYDFSKTGVNVEIYQIWMETLLEKANRDIINTNKFRSYKFDLSGSLSIGKIIVLEKK